MIRDEDGALIGYIYIDLNTRSHGGFVQGADWLFRGRLNLAPGYLYKCAGECEFELRS